MDKRGDVVVVVVVVVVARITNETNSRRCNVLKFSETTLVCGVVDKQDILGMKEARSRMMAGSVAFMMMFIEVK